MTTQAKAAWKDWGTRIGLIILVLGMMFTIYDRIAASSTDKVELKYRIEENSRGVSEAIAKDSIRERQIKDLRRSGWRTDHGIQELRLNIKLLVEKEGMKYRTLD